MISSFACILLLLGEYESGASQLPVASLQLIEVELLELVELDVEQDLLVDVLRLAPTKQSHTFMSTRIYEHCFLH